MEEYVEVTYQSCTLQFRPSKQLVGNTIFLISTSGTVAIPDDNGSFPDPIVDSPSNYAQKHKFRS